jgi:hypothetical protein
MLLNKERKENMKEKYTAPEVEIITFESEDVITTSEPELELQ